MAIRTTLTERLKLTHPIIQAPMAGGADTPDLVAAVSGAGGIGFIGAAYLSAQQIAEAARAVRAKTSEPFGINLFVPPPAPPPRDSRAAVERVAPYFAELGLPPPAVPNSAGIPFGEQVAAVLDSGAAAFSFTFGVPPADAIAAIKARGMLLAATATTVDEALDLEKAGMDAIVAQGGEAGATAAPLPAISTPAWSAPCRSCRKWSMR